MRVTATTDAPPATDADTIVVGVFEDDGITHDHGGGLQALVDSGEAKRGLRKLAVTHADGRRYIVAGLGGREDFEPEQARVVAATVLGRAKELGTKTLCWEVPHHVSDAQSPGSSRARCSPPTPIASSRSRESGGIEALILSAHHELSAGGRGGGRRGHQPRARPAEPSRRTCSRRRRWRSARASCRA